MSTLHAPASGAWKAIAIRLTLFALSIGALGSPTASSADSGTSGVAWPECTVKTPLLKKAWTAILGSVSLSTNDGTRPECGRVHRLVVFRRFCDGRHTCTWKRCGGARAGNAEAVEQAGSRRSFFE